MTTILGDIENPGEALWVIKWIDRFNHGSGFAFSPKVQVLLQKLSLTDLSEVENLAPEAVGLEILPNPWRLDRRTKSVFAWHQILVGHLPLVRIGDVIQGQRVVGHLRSVSATITLAPGMKPETVSIFDAHKPPPFWRTPYQVLNDSEFDLGAKSKVSGAQCMLIATPEAEYLIPGTVLLQGFYAFHTKLANAICRGQWQTTYRDVIADSNDETGLRTAVDEETQDWYIVAQTGMTRDHAPRLAALYLDPYGRECAEDIHRNAIAQKSRSGTGVDKVWFAKPRIPYRWDNAPFAMQVRGYPLRKPAGTLQRILVTSIDGHSWPHNDRVVHSEIANSSRRGMEDPAPPAEPRSVGGGMRPRPVAADPEATSDHRQDASAEEPVNQVTQGTFKFLDTPRHQLQIKLRHKPSAPPKVGQRPGASTVLSSGIATGGAGRPAPLEAGTRNGTSANRLQLLLNALSGLRENGEIDDWKYLSPPTGSPFRRLLNSMPCWSFLSTDEVRRNGRRARGWGYVYEDADADWGTQRTAHPRCLLVLQVTLENRTVLIFEIEPRTQDTGYCTYLMEPTHSFGMVDLAGAVERIREFEGRIDVEALPIVFEGISIKPIARRHHHGRLPDDDGRTNKVLDQGGLLRRLQAALSDAPSAMEADD